METKKVIADFLNERPDVVGAYGYGSGVFKQNNYNVEEKPQIDLILVVDNMQEWHKQNIASNPKDYSFFGKVRLNNVSRQAMKGKNHITYCALIRSNDHLFKYGLIEKEDFMKDLASWKPFYVAGRFHKPVLSVKSDSFLDAAIYKNRKAAFLIACILSEKLTTLHEIFCTMCSLSYIGDFRMGIAENPNKVKNIVDGSYDLLQEIYGGYNKYVEHLHAGHVIINREAVLKDLSCLPSGLLYHLHLNVSNLESFDDIGKAVLDYLHECNRQESINQALNGFLNNGVLKSAPYAVSKLAKRFVRN